MAKIKLALQYGYGKVCLNLLFNHSLTQFFNPMHKSYHDELNHDSR